MRRTPKALLLLVAAFAAVAGVLVHRGAKSDSRFKFGKADWDSFDYQLQAVGAAPHFNFRFCFQAAAPPVELRALVNCQHPKSYYYIEVKQGHVQLGRVEQELELRIGTRTEIPADDGQLHEVVIKRRDADLVVAVDGKLAARAFDATFAGGQIGLGVRRSSAKISDVRVQPVDDVFFSDDFMRAEADDSPWDVQAGEWRICSLSNPSLSSNAFYYVGKGTSRAASVAGQWFWDNYRVEASCRPRSNAAFGLYLCYRDPENHFLYRIDNDPDGPSRQVVKTIQGKRTVVGTAPGGCMPDQWYRLAADVTDGHVKVYLDDTVVLAVSDPALCFGKIGLYTEDSAEGTDFDDVNVQRWRTFRDDFEAPGVRQWVELGGRWAHTAQRPGEGHTESRRLSASSEAPAKVVTGLEDWQDYTFRADIGPWGQGTAGLCFYYLDEGHYYACRWRRRERDELRELVKVVDRVEHVLARQTAPLAAPRLLHAKASVDQGHIRIAVDDVPMFEAFDTALPRGKVGLLVSQCPLAWFDNTQVTFSSPPKPLLSEHEVFAHEKSMQIWSGAESDWEKHYQTIGGWSCLLHWHRAVFHGDVDVELSVDSLSGDQNALGLLVAADEASPTSGYRLSAVRSGGPWKVTLSEAGADVGEKELPPGPQPERFRLRKTGRFCAAYVDGRCLLWHDSQQPLTGTKIGYYSRGADVKREGVRVLTRQVYNELFRQAPTDWRIATGTWEVTNRWECDPRWSFFSGRSHKLAAIWNKRQFVGDVAVEFYAGIKMDQSRGRRYEYASDMNVTICGNGTDLNSGYNLMFGGWRNTATCIVRRGTVVAQTRGVKIPQHNSIHRRWFYVRAEKIKDQIALYIDNQRVLIYTDPDPLRDSQMAIWTYNNGLMVSRVRVSHEGTAAKEPPLARALGEVRCVYDQIPDLAW